MSFRLQWGEVAVGEGQPAVFEGRSLISLIVSNTLLDTTHGGEAVHATFLLEQFVQNFHKAVPRKLIVPFFDVLPYSGGHGSKSDRLLAEILHCHLTTVIARREDSFITCVHFPSWEDEEWLKCATDAHVGLVIADIPPLSDEKPASAVDEALFALQGHFVKTSLFVRELRCASSELRFESHRLQGFELLVEEALEATEPLPDASALVADVDNVVSIATYKSGEGIAFSSWILIEAVAAFLKADASEEQQQICQWFLLHHALKQVLPLIKRGLKDSAVVIADDERSARILAAQDKLSDILCSILHGFDGSKVENPERYFVGDLVSGRLFRAVAARLSTDEIKGGLGIGNKVAAKMNTWWKRCCELSGVAFREIAATDDVVPEVPTDEGEKPTLVDIPCDLLDMFDLPERLKSIDAIVEADESMRSGAGMAAAAALGDKYYYHSFSNMFDCRDIQGFIDARQPQLPETDPQYIRQKKWEQKKEQKNVTFIKKVSETFKVSTRNMRHVTTASSYHIPEPKQVVEDPKAKKEAKKAANKKGGKGGKGKGAKGKGAKEQIRLDNLKRLEAEDVQTIQLLIDQLNINKPKSSVEKLKATILELSAELKARDVCGKAKLLGNIQLIEWSFAMWQADLRSHKKNGEALDYLYAVYTFRLIMDSFHKYYSVIEAQQAADLLAHLKHLGLADAVRSAFGWYKGMVGEEKSQEVKVLLLAATKGKKPKAPVKMKFVEFQLQHCGALMNRGFDSQQDDRVPHYHPDKWQRELLDVVDRGESALVVAPTSSGKTFASFYAMRRVILHNKANKRTSDKQVLAYVSPTKALVNQMLAEVYSKFGPVVGVFTQDYRYNIELCDILVTVPQCLDTLLLSKTWRPRIGYAILDEVHCIEDSLHGMDGITKTGSVWEHLIDLLPCPFLALSATVGNPEEFCDYIGVIQSRFPKRVVRIITHEYRWSDLILHSYHPNESLATDFEQDVKDIHRTPTGKKLLQRIHPLQCVTVEDLSDRQLLSAIHMAPEECVMLQTQMQLASAALDDAVPEQAELKAAVEALNPDVHFKTDQCLVRQDVYAYESKLIEVLCKWRDTHVESLRAVLKGLEAGKLHPGTGKHEVMSLLLDITAAKKLPVILFSLSREECEGIIREVYDKLSAMNDRVQTKSAAELKEIEKHNKRVMKELKRKRDADKDSEAGPDDEETGAQVIQVATKPDDSCSFCTNVDRMTETEYQYWIGRVLWRNKGDAKIEWLVKALDYGIGVHHAGLPKEYRVAVEVLFRAGHVKVVAATSTLGMGINMPCQTVCLWGDSPYLSPLLYRQMRGRAGRRGYDNVGNVVFANIPDYKVKALVGSKLIRLKGTQPISPSVVLRSMVSYADVKPSDKAETKLVIRGLLEQPLYAFRQPDQDALTLNSRFLFRVYADLLYREGLIDEEGLPSGMAGMIQHLHHHEPANLALHHFLMSKEFDDLCSEYSRSPEETCRHLIQVLASLFHVVPVSRSQTSPSLFKDSSSQVVLNDLPGGLSRVLQEYNTSILKQFVDYIKIRAKLDDKELMDVNQLPLTGIEIAPGSASAGADVDADQAAGADRSPLVAALEKGAVNSTIRSPFFQLSGCGDTFHTAEELANSSVSALHIEASQIPTVAGLRDVTGRKLAYNAYVADYYKLFSKQSLIHENALREAIAWQLLKDWDMLLQTLYTSLYVVCVDPETEELRRTETLSAVEHLSKEFRVRFRKFNQ
mmetsp:Transcript_12851/g.51283  ORF Transcript_12851/g.51283 Transcript_12851/m.51283 type:complete len:1719 (+) Transcript_12851:141-5297(+)